MGGAAADYDDAVAAAVETVTVDAEVVASAAVDAGVEAAVVATEEQGVIQYPVLLHPSI